MADLFYLIGLRLIPFWLEIQNLLDSLPEKDVMTAVNSLTKSEPAQHTPQPVKWNVSV